MVHHTSQHVDICEMYFLVIFDPGWGYRAPRVAKLMIQIASLGGQTWLESLKALPHVNIKAPYFRPTHTHNAALEDFHCRVSS
jgi:hypothetical protein